MSDPLGHERRQAGLMRREHFLKQGYVKVDGFLEAHTVGRLRQALLEATRDDRDHELDLDGMRFHSNLFRRNAEVRAFVADPAVASLFAELDDGDHWVRWDQRVDKAPGGAAFPWHQDNAYSRLRTEHLQLWVALTDMDERNGGLWVDPGSHTAGRLRHRRDGSHLVCLQSPRAPTAVKAKAGDVVVFSSFTLHHTTPNMTDRLREAYVVEYLSTAHRDPLVGAPTVVLESPSRPTGVDHGRREPSSFDHVRDAPLVALGWLRRRRSGRDGSGL